MSGATRCGGFVATSGLVAPSALKGTPADFRTQTESVFEVLAETLDGLGATVRDVMHLTAYLTDRAHAQEWNTLFAAQWPSEPPARTTVVQQLLPVYADIEISAVAWVES
ncbi:hypothetical protein XU06_29430 (plasmid) [Rhodococcus erythropolis]|uniref:RidA family protein n=1 Tax=Rhodococcus erythropolis TaxID=1833 RepID=UPI00061B701D|nr:RidA family protein [Rhodococcus erythropolis]AKE01101.1 hypothetical protein XU06_29430 [Rhodococcus erythropolis]